MEGGFVVPVLVSAIITIVGLQVFRSRWMNGCDAFEFIQLLGGIGLAVLAIGFAISFSPDPGENPMILFITVSILAPAALTMVAVSVEKLTNGFSNAGLSVERYPKAPLLGVRDKLRNADIEGALADCERCSKAYPDDPEPLFMAARTAADHNLHERAARYLETIRLRNRTKRRVFDRASLELSRLYAGPLRNPQEAKRYLAAMTIQDKKISTPIVERSVEELATGPGMPMERARLLAKKGEVDKAVAVFREIYAQKKDSFRPLFEAATLLEKHGRIEQAANILRLILREDPDEPRYWAEATMRLARILNSHYGEHEAARDLWMKVDDRMKYTPFGKEARANLYGEKGELAVEADPRGKTGAADGEPAAGESH